MIVFISRWKNLYRIVIQVIDLQNLIVVQTLFWLINVKHLEPNHRICRVSGNGDYRPLPPRAKHSILSPLLFNCDCNHGRGIVIHAANVPFLTLIHPSQTIFHFTFPLVFPTHFLAALLHFQHTPGEPRPPGGHWW